MSSTATFFHALYLYFSCVPQPTLANTARKRPAVGQGREEMGCTNLEGEGTGLRGLGEVFTGALLVVGVELERVSVLACATLSYYAED